MDRRDRKGEIYNCKSTFYNKKGQLASTELWYPPYQFLREFPANRKRLLFRFQIVWGVEVCARRSAIRSKNFGMALKLSQQKSEPVLIVCDEGPHLVFLYCGPCFVYKPILQLET